MGSRNQDVGRSRRELDHRFDRHPQPDAEPKQVQLAMLEEEVQAANLKLSSKDLELELILEESTAREEQTQGEG